MNANGRELVLKGAIYQEALGRLLVFGGLKLEWRDMVLSQSVIRVHSRPFVVEEEENRE